MDVMTAFLNEILKEEMLKKYGFEQCDAVDIPMMERSKLDKDPNGIPVDGTCYQGKAYRKAPNCGKTGLLIPQRFSRLKENAIALSCNTVQHSRTKHIAIRYHFIKEQVENEVFELSFIKTTYQLADIITKALARERFEFLINRLGMQSITLEKLKVLAESKDEE
ncbi:hypothetical protein Tco_0947968 [Tanacetum coccineum]